MKRFLICALALAILMVCCFGCSRPAVKSEYESLTSDEIGMIHQLIELETKLCKKYGDKDYYPTQDSTVKDICDVTDKYSDKIIEKKEKAAGMEWPKSQVGTEEFQQEFLEFENALDAAGEAGTPEYKDYKLFEKAARWAALVGMTIRNDIFFSSYMEGNEERVPMNEQNWNMFLSNLEHARDDFYQ